MQAAGGGKEASIISLSCILSVNYTEERDVQLELCVFLARIDGEGKEAPTGKAFAVCSAEPRVGEWLSAFFKKAAR